MPTKSKPKPEPKPRTELQILQHKMYQDIGTITRSHTVVRVMRDHGWEAMAQNFARALQVAENCVRKTYLRDKNDILNKRLQEQAKKRAEEIKAFESTNPKGYYS